MRALVVFFCCLLCFSSNAENIKIGFIDTNQVVTSLSQYKSSLEQIAIQFEPKKQELLDLFKHIELVRSNIDLGDIRMSAGFGFAYLSPIGPIGAFISTPILKKAGDDIEEFGFSLGTGF